MEKIKGEQSRTIKVFFRNIFRQIKAVFNELTKRVATVSKKLIKGFINN